MTLKAPFPWFGGKSAIARAVWRRFGVVKNYVEPFFGSGAMLLNRPDWRPGVRLVETVNDADGLLANFTAVEAQLQVIRVGDCATGEPVAGLGQLGLAL